jgi:hypothetical protein
MDWLNFKSIESSLQTSTGDASTSNLTTTFDRQLVTFIPPEIFIIFALVAGSATVSKSYFDALHFVLDISPKIVVVVYVLGAWLLSAMLGWLSQLIVQGTVLVGEQLVSVNLAQANVQVIRWSLILG